MGFPRALGAALLALGAAACNDEFHVENYGGPSSCTRYFSRSIPQSTQRGIDLLFVVEDTPQMALLQPPVGARIAATWKPFQDLADKGAYADLHIGVVTTDMGAGATGSDRCEPANARPHGLLQGAGAAARPQCRPPVGGNWIHYD